MAKQLRNNKPVTEDRDQNILRRLANIEHKVSSLEQTNAFSMKTDADRHSKTVLDMFGKSVRRAQVYLSANGERSVQDIAELHGMKMPNVSRELETLQSEGLLEVTEKEGGKVFYNKKTIDRTVGISKLLMRKFKLDQNGNIKR